MRKRKLHELGQLIVACETYIVYKGKVLMHKRSENKEKFPGYWIGPGGHIDEGENVLSTAMREVKEETGIILNKEHIKLKVLAFHHHIDRREVWIEYLFRADIPQSQKVRSSKEGKSQWIEINKVLKMKNVFPPSKYYFDHILNNKAGVVYNFSSWTGSRLVKVISEKVGI